MLINRFLKNIPRQKKSKIKTKKTFLWNSLPSFLYRDQQIKTHWYDQVFPKTIFSVAGRFFRLNDSSFSRYATARGLPYL